LSPRWDRLVIVTSVEEMVEEFVRVRSQTLG
jgi:hypothetical protein